MTTETLQASLIREAMQRSMDDRLPFFPADSDLAYIEGLDNALAVCAPIVPPVDSYRQGYNRVSDLAPLCPIEGAVRHDAHYFDSLVYRPNAETIPMNPYSEVPFVDTAGLVSTYYSAEAYSATFGLGIGVVGLLITQDSLREVIFTNAPIDEPFVICADHMDDVSMVKYAIFMEDRTDLIDGFLIGFFAPRLAGPIDEMARLWELSDHTAAHDPLYAFLRGFGGMFGDDDDLPSFLLGDDDDDDLF